MNKPKRILFLWSLIYSIHWSTGDETFLHILNLQDHFKPHEFVWFVNVWIFKSNTTLTRVFKFISKPISDSKYEYLLWVYTYIICIQHQTIKIFSSAVNHHAKKLENERILSEKYSRHTKHTYKSILLPHLSQIN